MRDGKASILLLMVAPIFWGVFLLATEEPTPAPIGAPSPVHTYIVPANTQSNENAQPAEFSSDSLTEEKSTLAEGDGVIISNGLLSVHIINSGIEVYFIQESGKTTLLANVEGAGKSGKTSHVTNKLITISGKKATVEANWPPKKITVSLKRGSPVVELQQQSNFPCVTLNLAAQHLVVPSFIGDDWMISACDTKQNDSVFLPAENILLGLKGDGRSMVFVARQSTDGAIVAISEKSEYFDKLNINLPGQHLYIGGMEAENLWGEVSLAGTARQTKTPIDWTPSFSAKWQAVFAGDKSITSWELNGTAINCGPHGFSTQVLWPFQSQGNNKSQQFVIITPPESIHSGEIKRCLIYPMTRNKQTPPRIFLPEDMLRESLDTGICQYIQQRSGSGDSQGGPLCVLNTRTNKLTAIYAGHGRGSQYWRQNIQWILTEGLVQYVRLRAYRDFAAAAAKECQQLAVNEGSPDALLKKQMIENCKSIESSCDAALRLSMKQTTNWRDFQPPPNSSPEAAMEAIATALETAMTDTDLDAPARVMDLTRKLSALAVFPQTEMPRPRRLAQTIRNSAGILASRSSAASATCSRIRKLADAVLSGKHWAEEGR